MTVRVNRLRQWFRPGLLCIGDAAHAMSPIGGVGINLAIQDAVAAANMLSGKLLHGEVTVRDLRAVQRRREGAARLTQALQLFIQSKIIGNVLASGRAPMLHRLPGTTALASVLAAHTGAAGRARIPPGARRYLKAIPAFWTS